MSLELQDSRRSCVRYNRNYRIAVGHVSDTIEIIGQPQVMCQIQQKLQDSRRSCVRYNRNYRIAVGHVSDTIEIIGQPQVMCQIQSKLQNSRRSCVRYNRNYRIALGHVSDTIEIINVIYLQEKHLHNPRADSSQLHDIMKTIEKLYCL